MVTSPTPKAIESALRGIITELYRANDFDNLTVKRVRQRAEKNLGLESGWFKSNDEWRDRSSDFIQSEVARQETQGHDEISEPQKTPKKAAKAEPTKSTEKRGKKRPSVDSTSAKPTKKQKVEDESDADTPKKNLPARPAQVPKRSKSKLIVDSEDDENDTADKNADEPEEARKIEEPDAQEDPKSEGELSSLSSLIDDTPPPRSKNKSKSSVKVSKPSKAKPKKDASKNEDLSSKDDEIKTLQGWLLKCGIRKKWNQVLAPYETSKEKIAFLKEMLRDIGMDGRYSAAKAKQIKEERELLAELEAVRDFDKDWGVSERRRRGAKKKYIVEDEEDEDADEEIVEPKKVKEYDFADEESD